MLGFWRCQRLMGPPNGGLFHGGRFGSGALFVGGKVLFARRLAGPFGRWKGSVRFCSGGFFVGWKGSVRQAAGGASFVQRKGPFAHTLFIHGAALTANVSGALPAAPPTPPAPGQQNRRCAVPSPPFPRIRSAGIRHPAFPDLRPASMRA